MVLLLERDAQITDVRHDHRLAAGEDDVLGADLFYALYNFVDGKIFALGIPACVRRITPHAAQIASAGSDKSRGHAHQLAFALDGMEKVGDAHGKKAISFQLSAISQKKRVW